MEEIHEVTYHKDGRNWVKTYESFNPERVQRDVLDAFFRKYVCKSDSITKICKRYSTIGRNHVTVYYSNGFKSDYWF